MSRAGGGLPQSAQESNVVPGVGNAHPVRCSQCAQKFDAIVASWCSCARSTRTLICPFCRECFCNAPVLYKEKFWREAPDSLRQSVNRFGIGDVVTDQVARTDAAAAPRVLIVDDEEDMRSILACYVEQMGYETTTLSNPADALAIFDPRKFDVVVTDALMPRMDGRELCRKLKDVHGRDIKVILVTSLYTASRYRAEARHQFGVDEYLSKPVQYGQLKAALDRVAPMSVRTA